MSEHDESELTLLRNDNLALERRCVELKAQMASTYHYAYNEVEKASVDRLMGSGVLLQLTASGGKEIMDPVMIRDGLSNATIEAIKADLKRSYDLATLFKVE